MIINGQMHEWLLGSNDEDSVFSSYWNEKDSYFTLGDFKSFVNFLIDNSGRKSSIEEAIYGK